MSPPVLAGILSEANMADNRVKDLGGALGALTGRQRTIYSAFRAAADPANGQHLGVTVTLGELKGIVAEARQAGGGVVSKEDGFFIVDMYDVATEKGKYATPNADRYFRQLQREKAPGGRTELPSRQQTAVHKIQKLDQRVLMTAELVDRMVEAALQPDGKIGSGAHAAIVEAFRHRVADPSEYLKEINFPSVNKDGIDRVKRYQDEGILPRVPSY